MSHSFRTRMTWALTALLPLAPVALAAQTTGDPPAATEHDARPSATAARIDAGMTVRIDGRLDEAAWSLAPAVEEFTQIDPDEGAPATQRTVVRILYDDEALYVGARLYDTGEVRGRLGRRDMALGDSDWFGVMIDSYHDHRTAFGFDVNPAGVRRDEVKVIESDDNSWDPVWDVATTVDEEGWTAEYRIPFSQLRFSAQDEMIWGLQLERLIGRTREYAVSTFIPKSAQGGVPGYGHLRGLEGLRTGRRLELLPYVVARAERVDPGPNPYRSDAESGASGGLDLKYRVTSDLTLDATINPDFGQVEVDPAVINLGVYETRFDEKRPFFIEGSEIFDLDTGGGGQLFYTRRIGRSPQVWPGTPESDVPAATTILGAAKLSGRTAGGWSVGAMEALTERETARYVGPGGGDLTTTAEPLTNYFVGRARRDLRGGATAVGGIVTAVHRDLDDDLARALLRSSAYTGAADFRHEWDSRRWAVRGAVAVSRVAGDTAAIRRTQTASNHYFQRPDADHLEVDADATSLLGASGYVTVERQAGEHWLGGVQLATTTPAFEANDLGFSYRTDRRDAQVNVRYNENQPGRFLRNWYMDGSARVEYNYDSQLIYNRMGVTGFFRALGYWFVYAQAGHSLRSDDDRLTRGGPLAVRPAQTDGMIHFMTDARKPVLLAGTVRGSQDEYEGWTSYVQATLRWRPASSWEVSVGPTWSRRAGAQQYVATVPDASATATYGHRYVFAPLDYTEVGLETRLDLAFTPRLSLQVYAQPLLSAGDYGDPVYLEAPSTYRFAAYEGEAPDRDFNVRSLRGNAVLRWEWRQGSALYLAWQQSRSAVGAAGNFDFGRDRQAMWEAQPDNIFVVKVNYWVNP